MRLASNHGLTPNLAKSTIPDIDGLTIKDEAPRV
jgi:hypothetical protein